MRKLTKFERQLLAFEERNPKPSARKGRAIEDEFAVTPLRYQHLLFQTVMKPAALNEFPALTKSIRDQIATSRFVRPRPAK